MLRLRWSKKLPKPTQSIIILSSLKLLLVKVCYLAPSSSTLLSHHSGCFIFRHTSEVSIIWLILHRAYATRLSEISVIWKQKKSFAIFPADKQKPNTVNCKLMTISSIFNTNKRGQKRKTEFSSAEFKMQILSCKTFLKRQALTYVLPWWTAKKPFHFISCWARNLDLKCESFRNAKA